MAKNRLDVEKQTALVLQGLKGKIPLEELLRQYDVSEDTYHMLRDCFYRGREEGVKEGKQPRETIRNLCCDPF